MSRRGFSFGALVDGRDIDVRVGVACDGNEADVRGQRGDRLGDRRRRRDDNHAVDPLITEIANADGSMALSEL